MPNIALTLNLDTNPWTDLHDHGELRHGAVERIGLLPSGMASGRCSVAVVIRLDDGSTVVAETSLDLFAAASRALLASPLAEADGHGR